MPASTAARTVATASVRATVPYTPPTPPPPKLSALTAPRRPNGRVFIIGLRCLVSRRDLASRRRTQRQKNLFPHQWRHDVSRPLAVSSAPTDPPTSVAIRRGRGQDGARKTSFLPVGVTTQSVESEAPLPSRLVDLFCRLAAIPSPSG